MALTPYDIQQDLAASIEALRNARARLAQTTDPELRAELERFIADTEQKIQRLNAQLLTQNVQSTGETVKEEQQGNAEAANTQSPQAPDLVIDAQGDVVPRRSLAGSSEIPSNADPSTIDADVGLNDPVRRAPQIQSNRNLAEPGPLRPNTAGANPGANLNQGSLGNGGTGTPTVASPSDDARGDNSTRALLREIFGETGRIQAKPNVLDQFTSYTYNISIYLSTPETYRRTLASKQKNLAGYALLMQSGGAPLTTGDAPQTISATDPGEVPGVTTQSQFLAGRNPYFGLDYYIDDVRLKSIVQGRGSRTAHNVFEMNFKIVEPNGITLIDNLYKAAQEFMAPSGAIEPGQPVNWASQNYLMVIRFYGYDKDGNIVKPRRVTGEVTDSLAILEKWVQFQFTNIRFRVANRLVEYDCSAVASNNLASFQSRNSIPYNVELTASTIGELLSGSAVYRNQIQTQTLEGVTATGLPREARGVTATADRSGTAPVPPAPPKADTAPKTNTPKTLVKGLVEALNEYQRLYADEKRYEHADEYAIVFKVPKMAEAELLPAGPVDKKKPPMIQTNNASQAKDGARQSNDFDSQNKSVLAGTTIMQFLDIVLRNSKYVTEQQVQTWNEKKQEYEPNGSAIPETAWYSITMQAEPLRYDYKRNDYAYKFTYQITPYLISDMKSQYFRPSTPWVPPKRYSYWFTGENTAVLGFEQEYNFLYYQTLTGPNAPTLSTYTDYRTFDRASAQTRSNEADQGQTGKVFEAPANAAESLYSPADTVRVKIRIVGDPDWIQQNELWTGVSGPVGAGSGADFDTVLPDGTLNFETREPIFELQFNKPADYNLNTGLIESNKKNRTVIGADGKAVSEAQISYVYRPLIVESMFSKGQFTQEISAAQVFFRDPNARVQIDNARPNQTDPLISTAQQADVRRVDNALAQQYAKVTDWYTGYSNAAPTGARSDSLAAGIVTTAVSPTTGPGFVTALPAAAAQAPTSGTQPIGSTAPFAVTNPPASLGSVPGLSTVSSPLTATQQQIIAKKQQFDLALSQGDSIAVGRLAREINQLEAQLVRELPAAPNTRSQIIAQD